MSDLPSREDIGQWLDQWARSGEVGWYEMFSDTLRAVASGRLVDRDTIDNEAAGREWVETIPYDVQYEWDDPQAVEIVAGILAAAIRIAG